MRDRIINKMQLDDMGEWKFAHASHFDIGGVACRSFFTFV